MKNFLIDLKSKRLTKKAFAYVDQEDADSLVSLIHDGFDPLSTRKAVLKDKATGKNYTMSFDETVASKALREEKYGVLRKLFECCPPEQINMSDHINKDDYLEVLANNLTNNPKNQVIMDNLHTLHPQEDDLLFCLSQTFIHHNRFPKIEGLGVILVQVPYKMPQKLVHWLEQARLNHDLKSEILNGKAPQDIPNKKM